MFIISLNVCKNAGKYFTPALYFSRRNTLYNTECIEI